MSENVSPKAAVTFAAHSQLSKGSKSHRAENMETADRAFCKIFGGERGPLLWVKLAKAVCEEPCGNNVGSSQPDLESFLNCFNS